MTDSSDESSSFIEGNDATPQNSLLLSPPPGKPRLVEHERHPEDDSSSDSTSSFAPSDGENDLTGNIKTHDGSWYADENENSHNTNNRSSSKRSFGSSTTMVTSNSHNVPPSVAGKKKKKKVRTQGSDSHTILEGDDMGSHDGSSIVNYNENSNSNNINQTGSRRGDLLPTAGRLFPSRLPPVSMESRGRRGDSSSARGTNSATANTTNNHNTHSNDPYDLASMTVITTGPPLPTRSTHRHLRDTMRTRKRLLQAFVWGLVFIHFYLFISGAADILFFLRSAWARVLGVIYGIAGLMVAAVGVRAYRESGHTHALDDVVNGIGEVIGEDGNPSGSRSHARVSRAAELAGGPSSSAFSRCFSGWFRGSPVWLRRYTIASCGLAVAAVLTTVLVVILLFAKKVPPPCPVGYEEDPGIIRDDECRDGWNAFQLNMGFALWTAYCVAAFFNAKGYVTKLRKAEESYLFDDISRI